MADRFTKQAEEILAICERLGIDPDELGKQTAIQPETMRKYVKGYQKASDIIMQSLRNFEKLASVVKDGPAKQKKPDSTRPHSWMETGTLEKTLTDLTNRLHKAKPAERKYILSNIRDVMDELDEREISSKPPSPEQRLALRAGEILDEEHSST